MGVTETQAVENKVRGDSHSEKQMEREMER